MCDGIGRPSTVSEALGMLNRALDHLNAADAGSLPASVQAEALRALERAGAKHTAARARVLGAFAGQAAYEGDGQGSARAWLKWQTQVTTGAAAGAVGWVRRLHAHPVIATALAAGDLSESWGWQICAWTDRLPAGQHDDADEILAAAARGGVDLAGLAGLAQEMYERSHHDRDGGDGFGERAVWLETTLGGAGRLTGDLTAGCSAALAAVLEALGKRAGPEDIRSSAQRRHDALEEACRRLVASGMLPGRAGQPTQIQVHMSLAQLRDLPGASVAEAAWAAGRTAQSGWLTGPDADAAACDATMVPIVTGHIDWAALDHLTEIYLAIRPQPPGPARQAGGSGSAAGAETEACGGGPGAESQAGNAARPAGRADGCGVIAGANHSPTGTSATVGRGRLGAEPLSPDTRQRLRRALLAMVADALSGPGGLAAQLRAASLRAGRDRGPLASVSLPLDVGPATETIPAHLRRAVTTRHPHCAFPGCTQPASVCDVHHIIPRSRAGPTSLANLVTMCTFHHKIVVHRWGWTLRLNSDGTTTATSPDGHALHSHGPPRQAALRPRMSWPAATPEREHPRSGSASSDRRACHTGDG
jgi:Domain of unknown function (DUF222)/HNH endonuclease